MQKRTDKKALLVMDVQKGIVSLIGEGAKVLAPIQKAIEAARQNNIPVIFVRLKFSDGFPEVSPNNKTFAVASKMGDLTVSEEKTQIHEAICPKANEPVLTKYRVSAFAGSNLEIVLRSQQSNTLVLSGISTSGVVLSTLREAADKDFVLTVLSDACFDPDPEIHSFLTEKMFPSQADVLMVDAWVDGLK